MNSRSFISNVFLIYYSQKTVFLLGDFDINLLNHNQDTTITKSFFSVFSITFIPHTLTNKREALIDKTFSSAISHNIVYDNLTSSFLDHLPKFWKGRTTKKWVPGVHKEFLPQIFAWWIYNVSCQKILCQKKYGFEDSISNVDLGLLQPNNQLMFSFVTFWFCYITQIT